MVFVVAMFGSDDQEQGASLAEAPLRAYAAFVEALDSCELGIELDSCRVGNSTHDPGAMLKLLV